MSLIAIIKLIYVSPLNGDFLMLELLLKGGDFMVEEEEIFKIHGGKKPGVLSIKPRFEVKNKKQLGEAYTPGVAQIAKLIEKEPSAKSKYTTSGKLIAIVSDGTAVLGLGNISPAGSLPIIEGKALLYKDFAGVDAIPLAIDQISVDQLVENLKHIATSFAGFHLEDIKAPRCFELEEKLAQEVNIPVYHDDQEGTAIVVLAALINAAKVVHKKLTDLKVLVNGVGASGYATAKLLLAAGIKNITLVDVDGPISANDDHYNKYQRALAKQSNVHAKFKSLSDAIEGQDVFIGLSVADVLTPTQIKKMSSDPIIFALANPKPEIDPILAHEAGVKVMATGSSQYPNQVNNVLVFPGLFKGLLESGIKKVTSTLEIAIAEGLSKMVPTPQPEKFIAGVFDDGVVKTVTNTIMQFSQK